MSVVKTSFTSKSIHFTVSLIFDSLIFLICWWCQKIKSCHVGKINHETEEEQEKNVPKNLDLENIEHEFFQEFNLETYSFARGEIM